jgi:uncharacterized protein (TIGR00369 family)
MPFYRFMGIRLVMVGWGRSEIRMKVGMSLTQSAGFAHGGVSASLVDSAVGLALCTMIDRRNAITTVNLHVNFLAPAKPGLLIARGRIVHKGKRTAVGECEVVDEDGNLVSKGTATYLIFENKRPDPLRLS